MGRLTKRLPDDLGAVPIGGYGWPEIAAKLAQYEDAEEQGRLIVLPPVQIGETLFYVINGKIYEGELYRVAYENYHGRIHTDVSAAKGYNSFGSRFEDIGKTVFLSREEAEKALEGEVSK